ncbi:MAG: ABC transporter permease, partial [Dehalococcoidales bacterium]|nr:ABC transporter permease [Dehalococcoidales bacterium]
LCMRLLPGDPILVYMSGENLETLDPASLAALRAKYGLDKPLPVQYINWVFNIMKGDFGTSIIRGQPVNSLLAQCFPITVHLGVLAFAFGTVTGIFSGVICALRRGTWIDNVITLFANAGITMPTFWLGILLIYFFSLKLGWLPTSGYTSPFKDFWLSTRQVIMPVICLSFGTIAGLCRLTRSSMLEVIRQDYVRTAWAKGLKERVIVIRHELKNGLIPIVTIMGMQVGMIFGGSVIIETIFNIPGVGRLTVNALFEQDYQIVQASVLIMGMLILITNLLVDISYAWLDPRIRYS